TKAKSGKGTNTAKSSGGNNGTNLNAKRSNTTQDDVKFNLNIKNTEQKRDEFDDDEENPLAKIPTKARLPKKVSGLL
nr:ZC21.6 protein - Caenorhabditis elegans [Caenorhabditis elegans]